MAKTKAKKKESDKLITIGRILNNEVKTVRVEYDGKEQELKLNCPFDTRNYSKAEVLEAYRTIILAESSTTKFLYM